MDWWIHNVFFDLWIGESEMHFLTFDVWLWFSIICWNFVIRCKFVEVWTMKKDLLNFISINAEKQIHSRLCKKLTLLLFKIIM